MAQDLAPFADTAATSAPEPNGEPNVGPDAKPGSEPGAVAEPAAPVTAAVLMAVYGKADPGFFIDALEAVIEKQTRRPDFALVVVDGPAPPALLEPFAAYRARSPVPVEVLHLPKNVGHSCALRAGVEKLVGRCTYVIRTDADDLNRPERIAEQIAFMEARPEMGVASSQVAIFEGDPSNRTGRRTMPAADIYAFARTRTPINHSVTIFRTRALEDATYPDSRLPFEDWWISLRLVKAGWRLGVVDKEHLDFRGGSDMIARRHGFDYAKLEIEFLTTIHREGLISTPLYLRNIAQRIVLRLMPLDLVRKVYALKTHR